MRAESIGYQVYATGDLGTIAYETSAREGLVVDEGVIVEIVRPGTGDSVAPGDVGEVVVTTLHNADYPLLRFGTGDLSALLPGRSALRAHEHADQGLDGTRRPDDEGQRACSCIRPRLRRSSGAIRRSPVRLVVDNPDGNDRMVLHVEMARGGSPTRMRSSPRSAISPNSRGEVAFRTPGDLPNDGKVIDDTRKFD